MNVYVVCYNCWSCHSNVSCSRTQTVVVGNPAATQLTELQTQLTESQNYIERLRANLELIFDKISCLRIIVKYNQVCDTFEVHANPNTFLCGLLHHKHLLQIFIVACTVKNISVTPSFLRLPTVASYILNIYNDKAICSCGVGYSTPPGGRVSYPILQYNLNVVICDLVLNVRMKTWKWRHAK